MYKKLKLDFKIPEMIENDIDALINNLNNEDGTSEDCYRSDIDNLLKIFDLPDDQTKILRDYYVRGGIYDEHGKPQIGC